MYHGIVIQWKHVRINELSCEEREPDLMCHVVFRTWTKQGCWYRIVAEDWNLQLEEFRVY
jgi:hypothetical protein